ncbi:hypothetical protein Dcar01_00053 [Deinococcus carri]|uniref:Cation transporter n=1 Tax=Deinococcus carri TaxID=1211323 RepID=A0ABP9W2L9_9DEIO
MEALFALLIGLLVAAGVFLLLSRKIVRVVLGLTFIGYAGNLAILTVAGLRELAPPLLTVPGPYMDPLPQALILTAIVIGFATTALLLTVALRAYQVAGHDNVAAFGDNLARDPQAGEGRFADPEHQGPDLPDLIHSDPEEPPEPDTGANTGRAGPGDREGLA